MPESINVFPGGNTPQKREGKGKEKGQSWDDCLGASGLHLVRHCLVCFTSSARAEASSTGPGPSARAHQPLSAPVTTMLQELTSKYVYMASMTCHPVRRSRSCDQSVAAKG